MVTPSCIPTPGKSTTTYDALGPYSEVGLPQCRRRLLACLYRYDTPDRNRYRPRGLASRSRRRVSIGNAHLARLRSGIEEHVTALSY